MYWKKRCTIRWVKFGDENTKFFHATAAERYRKNVISQLTLADGRIVTDHQSKSSALWHSFKNRLGVSTCPVKHFNLAELISSVDGLATLSTEKNVPGFLCFA